MALHVKGLTTTHVVEVTDENALPVSPGSAAPVVLQTQDNRDSVTRTLKTSQDYQLLASTENTLLNWNFGNSQAAPAYIASTSTGYTYAITDGALVINTTQIFGNGTYNNLQQFYAYPNAPLRFLIRLKIVTADEFYASEVDVSLCSTVTGIEPSGVGWLIRQNQGSAYVSSQGMARISDRLFVNDGAYHDYEIIVWPDRADFFRDGELLNSQSLLVANASDYTTSNSLQLPYDYSPGIASQSKYNFGIFTSGTITVHVGRVAISQFGGQLTGKAFAHAQAASNQLTSHSSHPSSGSTIQTANYVADTAPVAATNWSNTSPAYATLGGLWRSPTNWPAAGETDYMIFAYQAPAQATGKSRGQLYITEIRLSELVVTTALTGGPGLFQWRVTVGSSADYTTTDAAAAVSHRSLCIGTQTLAAAADIASRAAGITLPLETPIMVPPGWYITIGVKLLGTDITAGVVRGMVGIDGYWE